MYSKIIISFLIFYVIQHTNSYHFGPVPFSTRIGAPKSDSACTKEGWSCTDCNTLRYCNPEFSFDFVITCKEKFSDKPYCNSTTKTCVAANTCVAPPNTGFICPDKNIYPDITNCKNYIACTEKGKQGIVFKCMFNGIYDSATKSCSSSTKCYSVKDECNKQSKTIPYKPDPTKYIVCRGKKSPILKSCGAENLEYDPETSRCEFVCKKVGIFKHPYSKKKFYYCINFEGMMQYEVDCPKKAMFDEEKRTCVPDPDADSNESDGSSEEPGSGDDSVEYFGLRK